MLKSSKNPGVLILTAGDMADKIPKDPKSVKEWFRKDVQEEVSSGKYALIVMLSVDNIEKNTSIDICYANIEVILEEWELTETWKKKIQKAPKGFYSKKKVVSKNPAVPPKRDAKGHFIKSNNNEQ